MHEPQPAGRTLADGAGAGTPPRAGGLDGAVPSLRCWRSWSPSSAAAIVDRLHRRSRSVAARPGGTRRIEVHSTPDAHRPAVGQDHSRRLRRRGSGDRGSAADRSSLPAAKKIEVVAAVVDAFSRRELIVDSVEMTDWDMVVETWPSSPSFRAAATTSPSSLATRNRTARSGSRRRSAACWRRGARSPTRITGRRGASRRTGCACRSRRGIADRVYRGGASFTDSVITIQKYEPFHANMRSRFTIEGPHLQFSGIDLVSEGARSQLDRHDRLRALARADSIRSRRASISRRRRASTSINTPSRRPARARSRERFICSAAGRELKGTFDSPMAGVNAWRFPNLHGSVLWLPDRLEITNATSGLYGGTAQFDYKLAPLNEREHADARDRGTSTYRDVDLPQLTDFLEIQGIRLGGRTDRTQPSRNGSWASGAPKRGDGEFSLDAASGRDADDACARSSSRGRARPRCRPRPVHSTRTPRLATCRSAGTCRTRSIPNGSRSGRARSRRRRPTSSSKAARHTASDRRFRFTSPASTGSKAIGCSPAS